MARLHAIDEGWNGSGVVSNREVDELFLDKLFVAQLLLGVIDARVFLVARQPFLSRICLMLVEREADRLIVFLDLSKARVELLEEDDILFKLFEVLFCLSTGRGAETFVVFDLESTQVALPLFLPLLIVRDREERPGRMTSRPTGDSDDWSYELFEESMYLEKTWPEMVEEVDYQPFDM